MSRPMRSSHGFKPEIEGPGQKRGLASKLALSERACLHEIPSTCSAFRKWSPGPNWEERAGGRSAEEGNNAPSAALRQVAAPQCSDTRDPPVELPSHPGDCAILVIASGRPAASTWPN